MKKPLAWMVGVVFAVNATGALAADKPKFELVARTSDRDGHELTEHTYFTHDPVALSDGGDVAAALSALSGQLVGALWLKPGTESGAASRIAYGKRGGYLLRYPRFTPAGGLIFEQVNESFESEGLMHWDRVSGDVSLAVPSGGLMGIAFFGASQVLNDGRVAYLGKTAAGAQVLAVHSPADGRSALVAATVSVDQRSGYSYLFNPAINARAEFAGKVRLGATPKELEESRPDQIRVWTADGKSVLVAQDRDSDPASPFSGFDNGVALSEAGVVGFVADLANGGRGVYVWTAAGGVRQVASTLDAGLAEIELFAPAVNDAGTIAFRGKNREGLSALFAGNVDQRWAEMLREGDGLPSDLGIARLAKADPMASSAFAGGLSINQQGRVAFRCTTVAHPQGGSPVWSSAIYVMRR